MKTQKKLTEKSFLFLVTVQGNHEKNSNILYSAIILISGPEYER